MMPGLGEKYDIEIETISKPRAAFSSTEYLETGLPKAPAIMAGDEVVVEGGDISGEKLEVVICKYLGLSPPAPHKKGILGLFLDR